MRETRDGNIPLKTNSHTQDNWAATVLCLNVTFVKVRAEAGKSRTVVACHDGPHAVSRPSTDCRMPYFSLTDKGLDCKCTETESGLRDRPFGKRKRPNLRDRP